MSPLQRIQFAASRGVSTAPDIEGPHRPSTWYQRVGKRSLDLTLGSALLVVSAPLLIAVALVLRVSLGRGVVIRQRRVGKDGTDFDMLKFRTMRADRRNTTISDFDGPDRRNTHKSIDDPRHTPIGRVLRRISADELPQLLHVLSGRMSLVGPRPELSHLVDHLGLRAHPRHQVRPGLTGSWQVTRRAEHVPLHECFDDDLEYVATYNARDDLKILARTATAVLRGSGM